MSRKDNELIDLNKMYNGKLTGASEPRADHKNELYLDGISDYVDLGNWFNYQNFTISLWVKAEKYQVEYADILDNNHTNNRSFNLQQKSNHINRYGFGVHTLKDGAVNVEFDLDPGKWAHLVLTKKRGKIFLYKNADLIGKNTVPGDGNIYYDGTEHLYIGRWGGGGRNWNGSVKDIRIYDVAQDESSIQKLYRENANKSDTR